MSRRTVYMLAGIFVVLVALVAVSRWWLARPSLPARAPFTFGAVSRTSADRIVIGSREATVALVNVGGTWRIGKLLGGHATASSGAATAAAAQIDALFNSIGKARFERLVDADGADPGAYGLDKGQARTVVFKSGETTQLAFLLGAGSEVPGSDYVKAPVGKAIWSVSGGLRDQLDPNAEYWREKPVPKVAPGAANTGTVVPPGLPPGLPPGTPGAPPAGP